MLERSGASALASPPTLAQRIRFGLALDGPLLTASAILIVLGLLMVASASMPLSQDVAGNPLYYFYRQLGALATGLVVGVAVLRVPTAIWYRSGAWLLLAAVILLILVLLPGVGREVNGSSRWIPVGPVNVQVSELAKIGVLIYAASYLQRHNEALKHSFAAMLRLMAVLALVALLLLLEPDFGATVVLGTTVLGMVFMAGIKIGRFVLLQVLVLCGLLALIYSSEYRWKRLASFMDPWQDPFGGGFQLTQALIAIGRGELFGVGLGASIQKHHYLPEAHTDFIFAIIAEELGLLGVLLVLTLYAVLVWRAFAIGHAAEEQGQRFGAYLAYGIGLLFALQSLINIGVNMGVLPTKGLTLPMLSYGGSSLLTNCIALALLLRINWETLPPDTLRRAKSDGPTAEDHPAQSAAGAHSAFNRERAP